MTKDKRNPKPECRNAQACTERSWVENRKGSARNVRVGYFSRTFKSRVRLQESQTNVLVCWSIPLLSDQEVNGLRFGTGLVGGRVIAVLGGLIEQPDKVRILFDGPGFTQV